MIGIFILLIGFIWAVDFTPQGNINLRGVYNITNGVNASFSGNVSAGFFQGDGSGLTSVTGTDNTWVANWTAYNSTAWTTTIQEIWDVAGNGTLFFTSNWNATNTSYLLISNWNATNTSYLLIKNWNSTNTSYYLASNPDEFIDWTIATNGTLFLTENWNATNTSYITQASEGNLNVNSSDFWDALDSPSDINAGDITDDGTYLLVTNWNATNDSYLLIKNWNATNASYVPYTGATSNLNLGANNFSVDSSVLFVDKEKNYVGIGTATPDAQLHIKLSDTTLRDGIRLETSLGSSEDWYVYMDASDDLVFRNDVDDYVTFQNDTGYVGIGTSSPDSIFHIKANFPGIVGSDYAGQLIIQNPANDVTSNVVITAYESDGSGNPDQQLWYLGSSSVGNSDITFLTRRNAKLALGTNGSSRLTILGNGYVGIGTLTPQRTLHVNGDILSNATINATTDVCIEEGVCLSGVYTKVESDAINTSNNNFILYTNSTMKSYVDAVDSAINDSNNNYIGEVNDSVNNWITQNNNSVNNYILYTNETAADYTDSKLITNFFNASTNQTIIGTPSGTIDLLQNYDSISHNVSEVSSDIDFRVNFTGITSFNQLIVRYKADSTESHVISIQIWDYIKSVWENYRNVANTENEYEIFTMTIYDEENHISGGVTQVRSYSINSGGSTHLHQFDWVEISDGPATPSSDETDPHAIHKDGNIALEANWGQGAFNLTNTVSWFLGKIQAANVNGLTAFVNALISTNNDSVNNYITENNVSVNNYIAENNDSVNNYILYVNSTAGGGAGGTTDSTWVANWTAYNSTDWTTTIQEIWDIVSNGTLFLTENWNATNASYLTSYTETDPFWTANWTNVAFTNAYETFDELINFSNNISIGTSEGDNGIYFYEGGSAFGEQLFWDDSLDQFSFTDKVNVESLSSGQIDGSFIIASGDILTSGAGDDLWLGTTTQGNALFRAYANGSLVLNDINSVANITVGSYFVGDGRFLTNVAPGAESDPKWTANWTNVAFTNIAELFGSLVTFANNITLGNSEGDNGIYFYEAGSATGEQFYWDDSADQFYITDDVEVEGNFDANTINADGSVIAALTITASSDIKTTGVGDDLWLGTTTQGNALFRAFANGTLILNDLLSVANITSGAYFVGDGRFLTDVPYTETDPFWTANYSTFLTHATTTYVDAQNTSMKNYVDDTFLQNIVGDTTPQLGGYLDANGQNIGSTSDEIENIYVGDNTRIYFGDGQDASIYFNGTNLIISG